jgi:hypothetical protein
MNQRGTAFEEEDVISLEKSLDGSRWPLMAKMNRRKRPESQ